MLCTPTPTTVWPASSVVAYATARDIDNVAWVATTPFGILIGFKNGTSVLEGTA
mgnify:CR=1 FL=1